MVVAVEDDSHDMLVLRQGVHDRVTLANGKIQLYRATFVMTGCPDGYGLTDGICHKRYDDPKSYVAAQKVCADDGGHMCTYAEAYLIWGDEKTSAVHKYGDFIGEYVGESSLLYVNDSGNRADFDGNTNKYDGKNFVCCINPR